MKLASPQALGKLGKVYHMPGDVASGSNEIKKAWAIGMFMGTTGGDACEVKNVFVNDVGKTYDSLEVHELSPQLYAVLEGSVAIPASPCLDGSALTFYEVHAGEALILNPNTWHGGATGIKTPATVVVILRKGTTEFDTKKSRLLPAVTFSPSPSGQ